MAQPEQPAADDGPGASKAWFWVPILPLVALDLWSKAAAFGFLDQRYPRLPKEHRRHDVFELDLLHFQLVRWSNTGTLWGLFQGYTFPLVIVRCVAVVAIVVYVIRLQRPRWGLLLVLAGILSGALGNLYDNLTQPDGGVRDFLFFIFFPRSTWESGFPAFNVADACISVGVVSLVLSILFEDRRAAAAARRMA